MAFQPRQFRELIVRPVLKHLDPEIPYSTVAEELIMFTVAHESDMGTYIAQYPRNGPARGISMIERETFNWLTTVLISKPMLHHKFEDITINKPVFHFDELAWNLALAVAFTRLRYAVIKVPLPTVESGTKGLAKYWAKWYQTEMDEAKIAEAIKDYRRFVY